MNDNSRSMLSEMLLTDDQLRAAGCLALESTHLEMYITSIILTFDDNTAKKELDRLMLGRKIKLMRKLIRPHIAGTPQEKTFNVIYNELKVLVDNRNAVIHGDWGLGHLKIRRIHDILKRKGKAVAKLRKRSIKADEIMQHARDVSRVQGDLLQWFHEHIWGPAE